LAKRAVSLSNEVQLVMDAVRGVHALTRKFIDSYGMETELPETISALLVVLVERLRLADRVLRGSEDPHLLWCPENDASTAREGDDHVLPAWSDKRLARHHRTELKRAKVRLHETQPKAKPTRSTGKPTT
jgi:hypothetical protein